MPEKVYTTMTRRRYRELIDRWLDGTLLQKWEGHRKPTTKAEQVEERQIKAIAMIYTENIKAVLDQLAKDDWSELRLVHDEARKIMRIQIVGRGYRQSTLDRL